MNLACTYRFEAAHRLTGAKSPSCQTPHGHTWKVKLIWRPNHVSLNSDQMLAEFHLLKDSWRRFIHEVVDHSFFHNHTDPILPTLKEHIPNLRSLAFPGDPTTELIAILFLYKAQFLIAPELKNTMQPWAITIQETPVNSVHTTINSEVYKTTVALLKKDSDLWWNNNLLAR